MNQSQISASSTKIRSIDCTGEPLSKEVASLILDTFPDATLNNVYGGTEMMENIRFEIVDKQSAESLAAPNGQMPLGFPVTNSTIYILDQENKIVDEGSIGEICIASNGLCSGYVNSQVHEESPRFVDIDNQRVYKTGDLGRVRNGLVYFEGRTDCQYKVNGQKIDLVEIEQFILMQKDLVEEAIVIVLHPHECWKKVLAIVKPSPQLESKRQLLARIEDGLPKCMTPGVELVREMPHLVNGKIDRQSLKIRYEGRTQAVFEYNDDELSLW